MIQTAAQLGPDVAVEARRAALRFTWTIKPIPGLDTIAVDYQAADGWIRLHTNAISHRAAALRVLDCPEDHEIVTRAITKWTMEYLESAIVAAGGCAASIRSVAAWHSHPQGESIAREPLIQLSRYPTAGLTPWCPNSPGC